MSAFIFGPVFGSSSRATKSFWLPSRYFVGHDAWPAATCCWRCTGTGRRSPRRPFLRASSMSADRAAGRAPRRLARRLDVRDVDAAAAPRLPMVIASSIASSRPPASSRMWLAYMPPCLARDLRQRDDLVGLRVGAGVVDQAGRQAPGAVLHRLVDEVLHLLQFVGASAARFALPITCERMLLCGARWMTLVPTPCSSSVLKNFAGVDRAGAAVAGDDRGAALRDVVLVRRGRSCRSGRSRSACAGR